MFVYVHGTVTAKYFPVPSFRPIWAFPAELWAHDYAGDRLVRELEQFGDLNRVQRDKVPYRTEFQVNLSISGRVMSSRRRRWPTGSRAGTFLRSSSCSACQSTLTYRVSSQSEHFRPNYEPKTTPVTNLFESWNNPNISIVFSVSKYPTVPSFRPIWAFPAELWAKDNNAKKKSQGGIEPESWRTGAWHTTTVLHLLLFVFTNNKLIFHTVIGLPYQHFVSTTSSLWPKDADDAGDRAVRWISGFLIFGTLLDHNEARKKRIIKIHRAVSDYSDGRTDAARTDGQGVFDKTELFALKYYFPEKVLNHDPPQFVVLRHAGERISEKSLFPLKLWPAKVWKLSMPGGGRKEGSALTGIPSRGTNKTMF